MTDGSHEVGFESWNIKIRISTMLKVIDESPDSFPDSDANGVMNH